MAPNTSAHAAFAEHLLQNEALLDHRARLERAVMTFTCVVRSEPTRRFEITLCAVRTGQRCCLHRRCVSRARPRRLQRRRVGALRSRRSSLQRASSSVCNLRTLRLDRRVRIDSWRDLRRRSQHSLLCVLRGRRAEARIQRELEWTNQRRLVRRHVLGLLVVAHCASMMTTVTLSRAPASIVASISAFAHCCRSSPPINSRDALIGQLARQAIRAQQVAIAESDAIATHVEQQRVLAADGARDRMIGLFVRLLQIELRRPRCDRSSSASAACAAGDTRGCRPPTRPRTRSAGPERPRPYCR